MDIKNEVLYRVYILLGLIFVPAAGILIYRTVDIAILKGQDYRSMGRQRYVKSVELEADRGNILADDGALLATDVPYFDLYFDPFVASQEEYDKNLDTLAHCLANYLDDTYTVGGYRDWLIQLRDTNYNRRNYVLLKKGVSYAKKREVENFPLFNLGQYRGGLIAEKSSERKRPFELLARRTIGYVRGNGSQPIGIEGYYDEILGGQPGSKPMILVDPRLNLYMPTDKLDVIEPRSGDDIVTTLDVNLQDITENALLKSLQHHRAEWGTAIVMEVKTGAIKAIANLGADQEEDGYYEMYNYAIAKATEPGSTFKLASIMALLEDDYVSLDDSIDIERGETMFYDARMKDDSPFSRNLEMTSVRRAFEISSNVGIAKLVNKYYGQKEEGELQGKAGQFIERLHDFNLHLPSGIRLEGEANPFIKEAYNESQQWSGITLPWMSTGYELEITPLQMLNFYNTVANGGQMMKPYLVSEIRRFGETIEDFKPKVVNKQIASKRTIELVHQLLEGVVERGTAYKLKSDRFKFAGKTGTAQVGYRRGSRGTRVQGYQASFAGYFPAEDPIYSCIVVVYKPKENGFYGSQVAGPVFREIADKCFNAMVELHDPINQGPRPVLYEDNLPEGRVGEQQDMQTILQFLEIPYYGDPSSAMTELRSQSDSLYLQTRTINEDRVPSVVGMGLRDALFILENQGLKVRTEGVGRVYRQSLRPGTKPKGQTVTLTLK